MMERTTSNTIGLTVEDWGRIDYPEALNRQKERVAGVLSGDRDVLIVCEHPPVITAGRSTRPDSVPGESCRQRGVPVLPADRGGDVTLHCPGQLVAYPILDLNRYRKDLKFYLRQLEQVAIDFLGSFGILASRISPHTGAWVGPRKIVSIGIGVRRWVSYHGLAVNVDPDLTLFSLIKPCGMDIRMTSIREIKNEAVDFRQAQERFINVFVRHFSRLGGGEGRSSLLKEAHS